jgi:multiple sugar transport system substrate-binding protein
VLREKMATRRQVLTGLAGVVAFSVVTACGGTSAPSGGSSTPAASTAANPTAATAAPTAAATTAPAATSAAAPTTAAAATAAPTTAPAAPAGSPVAVANPPTSAAMVDGIDLAGKNVEVTFWHNRPQKDQAFLQSMFDDFNKSNGYGITARPEIAGANYNDVYTKINAAIQAGQPPELSVAYANQAAFYRAQGAVIDLNPFIGSQKYGLSAADLQDYFKAFLASDENPQFKGERLGFPTQRSIEVMYHNVSALNQLGYDSAPTDWNTWETICSKFSDAAKNMYGFAFVHDASNFASEIFSRGGRILAADGSAYVFNSQAGIDAIALEQRLFKNKTAVEITPSEAYGNQTRFGQGTIEFTFSSSSGLPFYQQAVAQGGKFKWDIALLPHVGQPAVNLYGASVSVFKTTPEKELAAWLLIKFLGETPQTAKWAIQTGYLPVRASAKDIVVNAYKADPKWGPVADSYAKMFDWFQYAMVESPVAGYDPVRTLIDKSVMTPVITDFTVSPKSLLDAAVTKANQILKQNAPTNS